MVTSVKTVTQCYCQDRGSLSISAKANGKICKELPTTTAFIMSFNIKCKYNIYNHNVTETSSGQIYCMMLTWTQCQYYVSTMSASCQHRVSTVSAPCQHRVSTMVIVSASCQHHVSTVSAQCQHNATTISNDSQHILISYAVMVQCCGVSSTKHYNAVDPAAVQRPNSIMGSSDDDITQHQTVHTAIRLQLWLGDGCSNALYDIAYRHGIRLLVLRMHVDKSQISS